MNYFAYEKTIIQDCSSRSHLLFTAEGLNINKIIFSLLSFYNYPDSLCLVINFDETSEEKLTEEFISMRTMNTEKRRDNYKIGGVKLCLSQTLLSDLVNNIIKIDSISSIFILNAEQVKNDSLVAFIVHIITLNSPDTVIKAFSDDPIRISKTSLNLSTFIQSFKMNTVLLYPRFRNDINEELSSKCRFIEIKISMPQWLEDIQLYLLDLIESMKNEIERHRNHKLDISDYYTQKSSHNPLKNLGENVLRNMSHTLHRDLKNLERALELLFTLDFCFFREFYSEIYNQEIQNKGRTWILNTSSHVIMEIIESKIEQNNKRTGLASNAIDLKIPESNDHITDQYKEKDANSTHESSKNKRKTLILDDQKRQKTKVDLKKDFFKSNYILQDRSHQNKKQKELLKIIKNHQNEKCIVISKFYLNEQIIKNIDNSIRFITHKNFETTDANIIILLDFNLGTFRKIEQIRHKKEANNKIITTDEVHDSKVYYLFYKQSSEEEFYLNRLREEKDAFEKFISEKANLGIQDFDYHLDMHEDDSDEDVKKQYNVTIDYRELRSSLPFYLHKADNKIKISALEEGDYLFDNFIVERKSIYDLIGSLNNGRLLSQMTRIFSHHKNYYLLIEFDKRISLYSYTNTRDTLKNNLISKFCLLSIKFPQLRFIHSNNDILSVQILRELQKKKMSREDVNQIEIDPTLLEILLTIPGVNSFCIRKIQQTFMNLKEFISADKRTLCKILGSERGQIVFDFFRS